MASYSVPEPIDVSEAVDMNTNSKTWLQLYVDAVTEKDPYKRLALVQQLRKMPKHDDSEEMPKEAIVRQVKTAAKKAKLARRRH